MLELLTIREVCQVFGVSKTTLRDWHLQGRIKYIRLGKHCIRILRDEVLRIIEESKEASALV